MWFAYNLHPYLCQGDNLRSPPEHATADACMYGTHTD